MEKRGLAQVGERIKEIRRELRISQKEFAEKIEISGSFLSEVEANKSKPGYEFLNNIILTFNVNPLYLMTGKGNMFLKRDSGEWTVPDDEYGEFGAIVKKMLLYFKMSPQVKMAVLEFFQRYIHENKDLIEAEIKKYPEAQQQEPHQPAQ